MITVRPDRYSMFGDGEGIPFFLVTNPDLRAHFEIVCDRHTSADIVPLTPGCTLSDVLMRLPEPAHVLVVAPDTFVSSLPPNEIGHRKLAVVASNSTPCPPEAMAHFIAAIEATSAAEQAAWTSRFFVGLNAAAQLEICHRTFETFATFAFRETGNRWFFQGGPLTWGGQQIVPSGEVSVLPMPHGEYDPRRRLKINGTIALTGHPILHSGRPSFLRDDQQRLYESLASLVDTAIICTVRDGAIENMSPMSCAAEKAQKTLEALFTVDSRYRILWEFGIGINTSLKCLPGNYAMNETFGGTAGVLHWGLGLTPYTQYHLDIIAPGTSITDERGNELLGDQQTPSTASTIAPSYDVACACREA